MLGRREWAAAVVSALMAGVAVVVLAGLDDGQVVEVRVQGQAPDLPDAGPTGRVVWAEKGDVWLYETQMGQRRLTTDGLVLHNSKPRFRDGNRVTYLRATKEFGPDPILVEFDLASGRRHALQRLPGHIRAYDWSPDGNTLAYYGAPTGDGVTELHIAGNGTEHVRRFAPILGRGGFLNYDETRIEWSPDGRHLLMQDTPLDTSQDETLYILNADGSNATFPRLGTWARWSADSSNVYCLCATNLTKADWLWQSIDTATGVRTPLLITSGARPSLSPDGRLLAYDDGEDTPSVYVLDPRIAGAQPHFLARGAIAPIWLSPTRLAVTDTRPCPLTEDECIAGGHGSMFEPARTATALDLPTARRTSLPPIPTDAADTAPPA
jgi:Tol biopolymer transport system component